MKIHGVIDTLPTWAKPWAHAAVAIITDANIAIGLMGLTCVWAVWYSVTRKPPQDIPEGVRWLVGIVFTARAGYKGAMGWIEARKPNGEVKP